MTSDLVTPSTNYTSPGESRPRMVLSPDRAYVAMPILGSDGVAVIDLGTRERVEPLTDPWPAAVKVAAWSCAYLALLHRDDTRESMLEIRRIGDWQRIDGTPIIPAAGRFDNTSGEALVFSPDERYLALCTRGGELHVYAVDDGWRECEIPSSTLHGGPTPDGPLLWLSDNTLLACARNQPFLKAWRPPETDAPEGEAPEPWVEVADIPDLPHPARSGPQLAPDGLHLAITLDEPGRGVAVYDTTTWERMPTPDLGGTGRWCAFAPPLPRECTASEQFIDADYLVLTYAYTESDGRDLDTRTRIEEPLESVWVGWAYENVATLDDENATVYLEWGGDNTAAGGVESVMIDLKALHTAYPDATVIEIASRAYWYSALYDGNVTVQAVVYQGGTMRLDGYAFVNDDGTVLGSLQLPVYLGSEEHGLGEPIARTTYDLETGWLTLEPDSDSSGAVPAG